MQIPHLAMYWYGHNPRVKKFLKLYSSNTYSAVQNVDNARKLKELQRKARITNLSIQKQPTFKCSVPLKILLLQSTHQIEYQFSI